MDNGVRYFIQTLSALKDSTTVSFDQTTTKPSVYDFACGSGGFLIKSYEKMSTILEQMPETTFKLIGTMACSNGNC